MVANVGSNSRDVDVDPSQVLVSETMSQDPYVVSPEAPLDEVVSTMAEKK